MFVIELSFLSGLDWKYNLQLSVDYIYISVSKSSELKLQQ